MSKVEWAAQRFACTKCGRCCNRSPEVELSEAAELSDVFVFRLMFRLYWLRRRPAVGPELGERAASTDQAFYQKKRLLSAFAARKSPARIRHGGKVVEHTKYLIISALALETSTDACTALEENCCTIYERRPLTCRTVPFHYSRVEALAQSDLQAFVQTPGYLCDTGVDAPIVLIGGRIVDPKFGEARGAALALASRDRRWSDAILHRMKARSSINASLPKLDEIEENARLGATTTSMRIAWEIAADAGIIPADEFRRLVARQLATIERQLGILDLPAGSRQTLVEMQSEYRCALGQSQV